MKNKVVINKASSPKVVIGDLQRSVILETATTTTHVEDSRTLRAARHSGMTTLFNGLAFTLIELLVVVLIIGILAAVALPQYQKAVDRSRLSQMITSLNAIGKAQEVYYLANGNYSKDFSELDLAVKTGATGKYTIVGTQTYTITSDDRVFTYAWATDRRIPNITLYFFYSQHNSWPNTYACYAKAADNYANSLCKTVSGKTTRDVNVDPNNPQNVYLF